MLHTHRPETRLDPELSAAIRSVWLTVNHTATSIFTYCICNRHTIRISALFLVNPAKRLKCRRVMLWHCTTCSGSQRLATLRYQFIASR